MTTVRTSLRMQVTRDVISILDTHSGVSTVVSSESDRRS